MAIPNMSTIIQNPQDIAGFFGQYRYLSNFYPSSILKPTLEHHFQSLKTKDHQAALDHMLLKGMTAGQAKRYGKTLELVPDWDKMKDVVMLMLVRRKFKDAVLAKRLLSTGERRLIELNTWGDQYWGMVEVYGELVGRNQLGITLMQVRDELRRIN